MQMQHFVKNLASCLESKTTMMVMVPYCNSCKKKLTDPWFETSPPKLTASLPPKPSPPLKLPPPPLKSPPPKSPPEFWLFCCCQSVLEDVSTYSASSQLP
jgi:hypothetical protein